MKNFILICFCSCFILSSCAKQNLKNAKNSIDGNWNVIKIYSENTPTSNEQSEEGDLGTFVFSDNTVDYKFTRLEEEYAGNATWELKREKVNQGFTKVEKYTLTMDDYTFHCRFGDETSDAEKNATEIQLNLITSDDQPNEFQLHLKAEE